MLRVDTHAVTVYRVAVGALVALGVAAVAVAGWSLSRGGIGWDSYFDTGAQLDARAVDSSWPLQRAFDAVPSNSEFYGLFLYQFADLLHLLTTGVTEPLEPSEPVTYLYQGAATMVVSVASVTALAVALAVAYRSVLAGAFAWSLTLATPLWLGMSHVDFKDMPVVAGLTLVTAGCILAFVVEPPLRAAMVGALLAGSGGAITLGTRAGALALLGALTSLTAACVIGWGIGSRRVRATVPTLVTCATALVAAAAFTWSTNPIARIDMVTWLHDAAAVARDYPWDLGTIRVAGRDVHSTVSWWYVPAWLVAQAPVLTFVAVAGGFVALALGLARGWKTLDARTTIPLVPLTVQGILFPVAIVAGGARLYDGIRHLLFMIPAVIALAAVGIAFVDRRAGAVASRGRTLLAAGLVVVVAASLWASVRWAPYAYAFVNPVAGYDKQGRDWDLDYWGVSAREGVERLREMGYWPLYIEPNAGVGAPYGGAGEHPEPGQPIGGRPGLYVFLRWDRAADFGCTVLFTIERDGHVLGEGASCPTRAAASD
jgi:hypothetical protein